MIAAPKIRVNSVSPGLLLTVSSRMPRALFLIFEPLRRQEDRRRNH